MQLTIFDQSSLLDHKEDMEDTTRSFHEVYKETQKDLRKKLFDEIIKISSSIIVAKSGDQYVATVFYGFDEPNSTEMFFSFTYSSIKSVAEVAQALNNILEHIKNKYKKMNIGCLILKNTLTQCTDIITQIGFEHTARDENSEGMYGGWDEYKFCFDNSAINNND